MRIAVWLAILTLVGWGAGIAAFTAGSETALLLIDIQEFYFPGGKMALVEPAAAEANSSRLLRAFRERGDLVVHIRHNSEPGGEIRELVKPLDGERVISKDDVNAFKGTKLESLLRTAGVRTLVVAGMQTHMCVEAAVRAARDLGFEVVLIHDACATRDLVFGERTVPASAVHLSTLSTLDRTYARVIDTETFLRSFLAKKP